MAEEWRIEINNGLRKILGQEKQVHSLLVWEALPGEERRQSARAGLTFPDHRTSLVQEVADARSFQKQTVNSWNDEKLAVAFSRIPRPDVFLVRDLLIKLHMERRRRVLSDFLSRLGVEHENGEVKAGVLERLSFTAEKIRDAAENLLSGHPEQHVLTYFLCLLSHKVGFSEELLRWLLLKYQPAVDPSESEETPETEIPEEGYTEQAPEDTDQFTTLDKQIILSIVATVQEVEGSLDHEEVDDLVQELVRLNPSRHRTYFHLGFFDVLVNGTFRRSLLAENRDRKRWYWAGVIQGLARQERWAEILEIFDSERTVQELGDDGEGPSDAAARFITRALCEHGRAPEASEFLKTKALIQSEQLFKAAHWEGSQLLQAGKATEARGFYLRLGRAIDELTCEELPTNLPIFLEVRRRLAHCHRYVGELEKAHNILENLLLEDPDPDIRSMILTDLGLIDGGFRGLSDVKFPIVRASVREFVRSLEEGEGRFDTAARLDGKFNAHAHFLLGVRSMAEERWSEAVRFLELARPILGSEPKRYRLILPRVSLYLGTSLCMDDPDGCLEYACELICSGLRGGERWPEYHSVDCVEILAVYSKELSEEVVNELAPGSGAGLLEAFADRPSLHSCEELASALITLGMDDKRSSDERRRSLRKAIPLLVRQGRAEEAAQAMDWLEVQACKQIGTQDFVQFLRKPENFDPVWDPEDALWARVRCLESLSDYDEAANELTGEFHRILSRRGFGATNDAEAVIERIESYRLGEVYTQELRDRLKGYLGESGGIEPAEPAVGTRPLTRVLFVGGDERQQRHQDRIRADLSKSHPYISVEFVHPGWSGHWGDKLDDVVRLSAAKDAVVVSRLNRTEFARQLRKKIEVPWRCCGAPGKEVMERSIILAAEAAMAQEAPA